MSTVTISKSTYQALKRRAAAYERIIAAAREDVFSSPPTRDIDEIVRSFRVTKRYSPAFLKSLQKGLSRTTFFSKSA